MIPNNPIRMQSLVTISCYLFVLLCIAQSTDLVANENQDWQLKIDKHNIQVYAKATASGYSEVKAITSIKALPADFLSLLDDVAIGDQWIDNCEKIILIDSPNANERIVHSFFHAPWPVKNRDMVTHSKAVFEESGVVKIIVSDYSDVHPAINDYVRMENVRGEWTLKPDDSAQMTVSYEGYGEPSGDLPLWLANNLVKSSTFNTFEQMRTLLEDKYKREDNAQ